jgi:hypothetical protein
MFLAEYSLYLRVGDHVYHKHFRRWGMGVVVEERRSEVPGGFCYIRVSFQDGQVRVFDNNLRSGNCCYYAGVVRIEPEKVHLDSSAGEEACNDRRRKCKRLGR